MKRALIIALAAVLVTTGSSFAYTYTAASGTITIAEPSGDVVSSNVSATQPEWDSILTDLASSNKTMGEVPAGNLFSITPSASYEGDLLAKVYLSNSGNLSQAYSYLNMKLYLAGSAEAGETPAYRMLTLQNGEATFTLENLSPVSGTWTQTTQADFEGGTPNQIDTTTSPGDVILDTFASNVTDPYDDYTMITSADNVTISGGQAKLDYTGGSPSTEILRPIADGDEINIEYPDPLSNTHWDLVDDVTPDEDSTYVSTMEYQYQEDLYQVADHSTGSGLINYVRVYFRAYEQTDTTDPNIYAHIKTNGAEHNGSAIDVTNIYTTYWYQWNQNPETNENWTWDEIDALQIGIGLIRARPNRYTYCTQVFAEVGYTPISYPTSGTITSTNLLSGETVISIDSFDYIASAIPFGTSLKVQFSQDSSNWYNSSGTLNGWDTLSAGTHSVDLSGLGWAGPNFYYYMLFTSDGSDTPVLDEVSVVFSQYYLSGDLISSAFDTGYDLDWDWGTISFSISEPALTDIKFQIRTAATQGGLSSASWYGPTSTSDYYETSGDTINPVHDGDRWIQYRAYFSGPSTTTPIFSDISITYSAQELAYTIEIIGGGYCLISDNTSEWESGWTTIPGFFCEITPR